MGKSNTLTHKSLQTWTDVLEAQDIVRTRVCGPTLFERFERKKERNM
jgi:hypothetical protein